VAGRMGASGRDSRAGSAAEDAAALARALAEAHARIVELEGLAHVDELTGALNRRGFLRELDRAASYSKRYAIPVALALIDLDGLKPINDSLGHPAGDAVLRHVARVLAAHIRASDVVARLGGDEFALLLWHATDSIADAKMAALQALLAESPARWRSAQVPVRFSYGTVAVVPGAETAGLLEQADARLYAAKAARTGRTRP